MSRLFAAAFLLVAAAGCVDLSRPSVLVVDGPAVVDRGAEPPPNDGGEGDLPADGGPPPDGPDEDGPDEDGPDEADPGQGPNPDGGPADGPGDLSPDAPLAANGSPCSEASQCTSGQCVLGICCNSACLQTCHSCAVPAALGTCTPVPAGEDPQGQCAKDAESTCKQDGTCNGQGGCRTYPANTQCAPGSCSNAQEIAASTCDGSGTCRPGMTRACSGSVCMGASCGATCTQDAECQTGFYCDGTRCALRKAQAAACTVGNQCASGFCIDNTCCDSACGAQCYACNLAGLAGICSAVPSGQDPRSQCLAQAADSCGRAGGCNGVGACRLHPNGTACSASTCSGSTETAVRQCNGAGVCQPAAVRDCAPYQCSGAACATTCNSAAPCKPGLACVASAGARCSTIPNLALFWRFEEASGSAAIDDSGNNRNGSYTGVSGMPAPSLLTPPPITGYPNTRSRAFSLAARHTVKLFNMPAALRPTLAVTMAAWYRATTVDGDGSEVISGGNAYNLRIGPTQIELSKRIAGSFVDCRVTVPSYRDGNWHHLAGVISATTLTIYFDGVGLVACAQSQPISYEIASPDFAVGQHPLNSVYDFDGNIDEVRIYPRALSAAEVRALGTGGL